MSTYVPCPQCAATAASATFTSYRVVAHFEAGPGALAGHYGGSMNERRRYMPGDRIVGWMLPPDDLVAALEIVFAQARSSAGGSRRSPSSAA